MEENPAYDESSSGKMIELYRGSVKWGSGWIVEGGEIEITIEKTDGFKEGLVAIRYTDSQNVEQKIQKDLEEI